MITEQTELGAPRCCLYSCIPPVYSNNSKINVNKDANLNSVCVNVIDCPLVYKVAHYMNMRTSWRLFVCLFVCCWLDGWSDGWLVGWLSISTITKSSECILMKIPEIQMIPELRTDEESAVM